MRFRAVLVAGLLTIVSVITTGDNAGASSGTPDFGSNVHIFTPSMGQSAIQAELNTIAVAQVHNEFGTRRDAVLFEPGTYGTAANPLVFQVGYYTSVAGLGASPEDVHIKGLIEVPNQCAGSFCTGLTNFWRSLSNLTIDVTTGGAPLPATSPEAPGCVSSNDLYAVSQASPIRRVAVNGAFFLFDYCGGPNYVSGGFIADSRTGFVINAGQQQWITRNSSIGGWSNGVWNQVFLGVQGAPAQCFPAQASCGGPYTTLATTPVTREAPYLYLDASGNYNVFVPAVQHDTVGPSWANGPTPGTSIPIDQFYVAKPSDSATTINQAIHRGKNLILTPGVYELDQAIDVTRPDSIVLGLGFPTLQPTNGTPAMTVASAKGILVSGVLFDAGPTSSPVLLQVGQGHARSDNEASDPSGLYDVFFRIGGAGVGKATTALEVNSNNTILDDVWAWRADHGNGVGWTSNTADTGVIINGANVTAYGLFVEHFQKYEVIWNGDNGTDVFFQNELPYDPPSQSAWEVSPSQPGYPAFYVTPNVTSFHSYGMGSYVVFISTPAASGANSLYDAEPFQVPTTPGVVLTNTLTVWIAGNGGDLSIVDGVGGPDTSTNPGTVTPVDLASYS